MPAPLLRFHAWTEVDAPAQALFDWHEAPGAFAALTPPGTPVVIESHVGGIRDGASVILRVGVWPFRVRWALRHTGYVRGVQFIDEQVRGPFRQWRHVHLISPVSATRARLDDSLEIGLPGGWVGYALGAPLLRWQLRRLFAYRHAVTRAALSSPVGETAATR